MEGRAGTALSIGLALSFGGAVAQLAGCSQEEKSTPSACAKASCAADAPPLDFRGEAATFTGHFRVLDGRGRPLDKASVQVGKSRGTTDADGRVALKNLDAKAAAVVQVSGKNAAPYLGKTSAFLSGQRTQSLTLQPLAFAEQVDLEQVVRVQKDFGRLELEARSIANKGGTRSREARLELADLAPNKDARDALLPAFKALDAKGAPTALKSLDALSYVKLTDGTGEVLDLAATKAAILALKLPKESDAAPGDVLSLWSLDEGSLTLREESRCVVGAEEGGARMCKGRVPHFSVWAVGAPAPEARMQCIQARVSSGLDGCVKLEVERVFIESCDEAGERCREASAHDLWLSPGDGATPLTCTTVAESPTQRVSVLYDVDASGCSGADKPVSGRRLKRGDAKAASSQLVSSLARAFADAPGRTCSEACGARELSIETADLDAALLVDRDDDGYYVGVAGGSAPGALDCDDDDASVFPSAPELFCSAQDANCDGAHGAPADDAHFNAACALCGADEGREIPGNLRDEDCDGSARDRDGDGYAEPDDCDDFSAESAPGRQEIAGNQADEDCDGVAADWDGDGALSSAHLYLADRLGLAPSAFGDCDDFDAARSPSAGLARERGVLRPYFAAGTRSADYCDLFDARGFPSAVSHALLVDYNCDGKVTDADGDGYAAIGDLTLGAELATDCDDLDPRVHDQNSATASCSEPSDLHDESVCRAPPRTPACPALGFAGSIVQTSCEEALDRGAGTGNGVCAFLGWPEGDPLTLEPGRLWGPCDGGGPLPECPAGAQCGGPLTYTEAVRAYLEGAYGDGQPLAYMGMCFPTCTL